MARTPNRRTVATLATCAMLLSTSTVQARDPDGGRPSRPPSAITVKINGQRISLPSDRQPYIVNGRTLFPLRYIAEALGAKVDWGYPDGTGQIAWVQTQDTLVGFPIDQPMMIYDGTLVPIDQGATLKNGYTMLPIRYVVGSIGGSVGWDDATRTVDVNYSPSHSALTLKQKCALHGLDYDAEMCRINHFFTPQVYTSFDADVLKTLMQYSMTTEQNIAYLNKIAALHGGNPPRTAKEAINETINQVVTDIAIAEVIGAFWRPGQVEQGTGRPVQPGPFAPPERTGWAPNTQFMSERAIRWQAEVAGRTFRLLQNGMWEIEEYGYVSARGRYWFDAFQHGALIDAKTIPLKWLKGNEFTQFASDLPIADMARVARDQIRIVGGDHPIVWAFDTPAARQAWVNWLQNNNGQDILQHITFR